MCTLAEPLTLPGRKLDDKFACLVHFTLSAEECKEWIAEFEKQGFQPASLQDDGKTKNPHRTNDRVLVQDPAKAEKLFGTIRNYLPWTWKHAGYTWNLKGLNSRLSVLRYQNDERYGRHVDVPYEENDKRRSFITCQLYLNEEFKGGETRFDQEVNLPTDYSKRTHLDVKPKTGSALLFEHELVHEGMPVKSGTKYTIRVDVMYERPSQVAVVLDPGTKPHPLGVPPPSTYMSVPPRFHVGKRITGGVDVTLAAPPSDNPSDEAIAALLCKNIKPISLAPNLGPHRDGRYVAPEDKDPEWRSREARKGHHTPAIQKLLAEVDKCNHFFVQEENKMECAWCSARYVEKHIHCWKRTGYVLECIICTDSYTLNQVQVKFKECKEAQAKAWEQAARKEIIEKVPPSTPTELMITCHTYDELKAGDKKAAEAPLLRFDLPEVRWCGDYFPDDAAKFKSRATEEKWPHRVHFNTRREWIEKIAQLVPNSGIKVECVKGHAIGLYGQRLGNVMYWDGAQRIGWHEGCWHFTATHNLSPPKSLWDYVMSFPIYDYLHVAK